MIKGRKKGRKRECRGASEGKEEKEPTFSLLFPSPRIIEKEKSNSINP